MAPPPSLRSGRYLPPAASAGQVRLRSGRDPLPPAASAGQVRRARVRVRCRAPRGRGKGAAGRPRGQAFDADEQQRLAVIRRQPGQRPLDAASEFARRGLLEGGRPRRAARPEADQRIGCRVADGARAAVAVVEIARHGEEPGAETCVRPKAGSGFHQTQPGVLGQILGHLAAARQPREKGKDPRPVGLVDGVERGGIAVAQPVDERQLGVPLHDRHNAPSARP